MIYWANPKSSLMTLWFVIQVANTSVVSHTSVSITSALEGRASLQQQQSASCCIATGNIRQVLHDTAQLGERVHDAVERRALEQLQRMHSVRHLQQSLVSP